LYIALLDRGIRIYVLHGIGDIGIDRKESIHSSTHSGEILIPVSSNTPPPPHLGTEVISMQNMGTEVINMQV
jgi:hypothetical protein